MIGEIDRELNSRGFTVIGVDEAGRGPLCGPVTVAAVSLFSHISGVDDSKKLTKKQRDRLVSAVVENSIWSVYSVMPDVIDKLNILNATLWGMRRVVSRVASNILTQKALLVDGNKPLGMFEEEHAVVKGDSKSINIAAASIVAKYHRDKIMERWDKIFPEYNLAKHKGYPTKEHYEAIAKHGATKIHRKSFRLFKQKDVEQLKLF